MIDSGVDWNDQEPITNKEPRTKLQWAHGLGFGHWGFVGDCGLVIDSGVDRKDQEPITNK